MKKIIKYLAWSFVLGMIINACTKTDNLPYYSYGTVSVLTSSVTKVAAKPADSLKTGIVLNWSNPNYSTSFKTTKYVIEIDSTNRNFSKSVKFIVTGVLTDTITNKDLNTILLGFGFNFNTAYNVDIRVTSSYGNNNEQYVSNTITVNMTPYVVPPTVVIPTRVTLDPSDAPNVAATGLFIVGDATVGGWSNNAGVGVPVPNQQFYAKDSVTYEGVFYLNGGSHYLLLPFNGSWNYKYAVSDDQVPSVAAGTGGHFGFYSNNNNTNFTKNIPAPATSGWYSILVDFQHGVYSVTPYTSVFPTNLYIVGDATADSWNNSNPPVNPVFTQLNAAQFQVSMPLIGGKSFLMLPVAGSWSNKYAVANANVPSSGGSFGYNLSNNFNGPASSGNYTITANFFDFTFTVK